VELPRLEPLWQKYREHGLQVIAIESERDTERALEFIAENDLSYHLLEDSEGDDNVVASKLEIYGFPTSYLVDREGRILYSHIGFEEGDEVQMEEEIQRLLEL
jgi:peroxiredoxin